MRTRSLVHQPFVASPPRLPLHGDATAGAARSAPRAFPEPDREHSATAPIRPLPSIPQPVDGFPDPPQVGRLNTGSEKVDTRMMVVAHRPPGPPGTDDFGRTLAAARAGGAGGAAAYRVLYDSLAGRVCGYLRFHGAVDPEDLTSEVFLRAFGHLDDFAGTEPGFRAWLFTIARHVLIDDHRRRIRRPATVELTAPISDALVGGDSEIDALEQVDTASALALLECLTPDQRDVVALRVIADLPIDEVAAVLGKERTTVKALQHRGIAALCRHLEATGT